MSTAWRTVRVFVCSTFDDMHAERDHLMKVVFPAVREQLRPYRVELLDVDPRWGVGQDQLENDRALLLALDQIDECRPFFIALVGARYGWTLPEYGAELRQKFPWVVPPPGNAGDSSTQTGPRSTFELEVAHGALNDTAWMSRALFCVRDRRALETIPEATRRRWYLETQPQANRRLDNLLQRIEGCSYPIEHYSCTWSKTEVLHATRSPGRLVGLNQFGERVRSWLWFALRSELKLLNPPEPAGPQDWVAEENALQERYRERCRSFYVSRDELLQTLQGYAQSEADSVCLVTGPPGAGKSVLLAQLARTYQLQHPKALVVSHHVGATPRSRHLRDLLGRLCEEIKNRLKLTIPIPAGTSERLSVFLGLLLGVPPRYRLLLVLDGLERLDPEGEAYTLHWLPERVRAHVKIVVSCQEDSDHPHPVLKAFQARKCLVVPVDALADEERRKMVRCWPEMPARSLTPEQSEQLLAHPATSNPLYLAVSLQELRAGSQGQTVEDWLNRLPPEGLPQLFEVLLQRLEEEFDPELVPTTLALLACARRGLSETELRDLTADCQLKNELFGLLRWLRPYLWNRGGQLEIYYPLLRQAVERCYLKRIIPSSSPVSSATTPSPEECAIRTRLAHYFGHQAMDDRQLDEVPWQLAEMRAWPALVELLSDLPFLAALWQHSDQDVKAYWNRIRTSSTFCLPDAYQRVLNHPSAHDENVPMIAALLQWANHLAEALVLRQYQGEKFRQAGDVPRLVQNLGQQASIRIARGDYDGAMKDLKQQEKLCRQSNDLAGLKGCLTNQAVVHRKCGEVEEALAMHKKEEQLCRQLNSSHGVALSLINQAHLLADRLRQPAEALSLAEEAYQLATRHGFNNLAGQIKARLARIRQKAIQPDPTNPDSTGDHSSRFLNPPESGVS